MKFLFQILIIFFFTSVILARETGETEITTEDGIEVFQNEKYYLLKKNVNISSDNFNLKADIVKVKFNKSLYDITKIEANSNVIFNSIVSNIKGSGESLKFNVDLEEIKIEGLNSELFSENLQMYSDGIIIVNNSNGKFLLDGNNSSLVNDSIIVKGSYIDGVFENNLNQKKITFLNVIDEKKSYVKNNNIEMYAKKIKFDNKSSLIELIDDVSIIRNGEKIIGDYGTLDTKNNSYKIKSNDETKVKVIIQNDG
tara:strand:- start:5949 stop:6710 length:762 start_codon:yes stop_codon:yes gene_type:complete